MKFALAMAFALAATAVNAAPFAQATPQAEPRSTVRYHLFIAYSVSSGVTTPIQLGPFRTLTACNAAASLVASKVAVAASACLKNQ